MNARTFHTRLALALIGAASLLLPVLAWADPPGRVARLSYLGGEVSFSPSGEDTWYDAQLNRPLVVGDRLWTDSNGRVELEMGTSALRLDHDSSLEFLNLDDQLAQVQLTQGVANLRIDHLYDGQMYEIDTPTLAMVVSEPGEYRIDIAPDGGSSQVTVFSGRAQIYGEDNAVSSVLAGNSIRFLDPGLRDVRQMAIPSADDFDRWAFARNDRLLNSPSRQYVSTEMIGYSDLDTHGSWRSVSDYGNVWFPRHVTPGWAPYRYGHWSWIDPWGWTWIDDAPWGFAPSHYGRWVYVSNGWGWVPGPRHMRPVYAPALVAFVGGSGWSLSVRSGGPPIGWFPLGPRDVYMPWYRVSRNYFGRVNVHNTVIVNNIHVTNIYNDYYVQGRAPRRDYTFRNAVNAVTVVPQDAFTSSRRAADSLARLQPGSLQQGELLTRAPATPTAASLVGGARSSRVAPAQANRSVIARNEPAPRMASFDSRRGAIARNGGEPLASDQLRRISNQANVGGRSSVRMAGGDRGQPASVGSEPAARAPGAMSGRGELGRVGQQPAPVTGVRGREQAGAAGNMRQAPVIRGGSETTPQRGVVTGNRVGGTGSADRGSRALPSSGYARGRTSVDPAGNRSGVPAESRSDRAATSRSIRPNDGSVVSPRASTTSPSARGEASRATAPQRQQSAPEARSVQPSQRPVAPTPQRSQSAPVQERSSSAPTQRSVQPSQRPVAPAPQRSQSAPVQQRSHSAPAQRSVQPSQRQVAPAPQRSQPAPVQQRSAPAPAQRSVQPSQRQVAPAPQRSQSAPTQRNVAPVQQQSAPAAPVQRSAPAPQRSAPPADSGRSAPARSNERNDGDSNSRSGRSR